MLKSQVFICVWVSSCRWCWSHLCTWPSQCTAAAASWLPSPPARCRLRRQAGDCRSRATVSGGRRWWAGPPPKARGESLAPAPGPRAEGTTAGVRLRGDRSEEEKKRQGEERSQLSESISGHPNMILQFRHHSGFRKPGSTTFLQHVTLILVFKHHCCHNFSTV